MDPRTKTFVACAQCGNGHWLPEPRLIQEDGETFCDEECREQRREYLKVKAARGTGEFPAVVAAYHRHQDERRARFVTGQAARRARMDAELAALDAAYKRLLRGASA